MPVEGASQSEEEWLKRFRRLASSSQGILSDENLLGSPFDGYAKALQRVSAFNDVMDGRSISFVAYVRPQPQWLESLYLQGIQQGNSESPAEFLDRILGAPNLQWSILGTVIRDEIGADSLDLRPYSSCDVVEDFFRSQSLGSPPPFPRDGLRINRSIAPIQGPILRDLLSDPNLESSDKLRIRRAFQSLLATGATIGFSCFNEAQQKEMRDVLSKDLVALKRSGLMATEALDAYGREVAKVKAEQLIPWAEGPEADEAVRLEALRCLQVLAARVPAEDTLWSRTIKRIRSDRMGALHSLRRRIGRAI
ncbi:hypothetical protein N9C30_00340 [bacterium]|nr:hypothetical protein [bacterium]